MKIQFLIPCICLLFHCILLNAQANRERDLYADTWVATDALGRMMPDFVEAGPVKNDQRRVVGIFYLTWHTQRFTKAKSPYQGDVTKILLKDPNARLDAKHPLWSEFMYHWGEPEMGYFLSRDEWVIRKDMSMLADAGVDVLVMDVTNAEHFWDEWDMTFGVMQKMMAEGVKVPKFCFWAFNGAVITVVQELYDRIYKEDRFRDLWFYWDDKPLLLHNATPFLDPNQKHKNPHYEPDAKTNPMNPHYNDPDYCEEFYVDYTKAVKEFFTLRNMWWGYYKWGNDRYIGTEDNWSFGYSLTEPEVKALKPEELLSTHQGRREEAAVTPAQHPYRLTYEIKGVGKSWSRDNDQPALDKYDMPVPTYVPWLGKTVKNPEGYGIYFQERWDEALAANPQFLYLNDWNEWTAGKFPPLTGQDTMTWLGRISAFVFVDQYNAEFNRCIQPMKGGYTDNYYMQMAQNIRKYKGIRQIPTNKGMHLITIDGAFDDWAAITHEFRDTRGDIFHRDAIGYAGEHYVNNSGRNDIITSKVAVDEQNISFWVETADPLTPHSDPHWMMLFIDVDNNSSTGWYGYDYAINYEVKSDRLTTLMRYNGKKWVKAADIPYRYNGNQLELSIPRKALKLDKDAFTIDFKWSDNAGEPVDPISFCLNGDTAPNRRFNYRFIWEK